MSPSEQGINKTGAGALGTALSSVQPQSPGWQQPLKAGIASARLCHGQPAPGESLH